MQVVLAEATGEMSDSNDPPPSGAPLSPGRSRSSLRDTILTARTTLATQALEQENDPLVDCVQTCAIEPIQQGVSTTADQWRVLLFGQVLSFLVASQGAAQSTLHLQCKISAPAFATGLVYVILTFHLIPLFKKDGQFRKLESRDCVTTEESPTNWFMGVIPLQASAWTYLGIALLDVEANYLTVLAYRYTSLTSVSVLDAMAIPSAMLFSRLCLGRRYVVAHLFGAIVCLCGMSANVFTDFESEEKDNVEAKEYPHLVLGDFLAMLGGLMFGARDVLTELSVKNFGGTNEYLGMVGLFGTLISFTQVILLERQQVEDFFSGATETCPLAMGLWLLLAYVATASLRYAGFAHFLVVSEAALLNLSLLTADLWSAIFEVVAERIIPPVLFWVSLALVLGGVFIYETGPSPIMEDPKDPLMLNDHEVELTEFANPEDVELAADPTKELKIS